MSLLEHDNEVDLIPPSMPMTEEEFLEVDGKAEWVEGITHFMSPVSLDHDRLQLWIHSAIQMLYDERGAGEVFGEQVAVRFNARQMRCPDVSFLLPTNPAVRERKRVVGVPDFIVEVVSAESVKRDYGEKLRLYQSEGVKEYLIVDTLQRTVELRRLGDNGWYVRVEEVDGRVNSEVIKSFYFRSAWLTSQPLPSILQLAREWGL